MIKSNHHTWLLLLSLLLLATPGYVQESYSLQQCLNYAVQYNGNVKKSTYDQEKTKQARKEVIGALMPQTSKSAALNDNLKKAKFTMPNLMNDMPPDKTRDLNASQYMTIEMGMQYSANVGAAVNQQILNMSPFNTFDIAKVSERMATLAAISTERDVTIQTATLHYGAQVTQYAAEQTGYSVELVEKMLRTIEASYSNGLIKKADVDRLKVNLTDLETQHAAIESGLEVQKNLLKPQMGLEVIESIVIAPLDLDLLAQQEIAESDATTFDPIQHVVYQQLQEREKMVRPQGRVKRYDYILTLSTALNAQYNYMSNKFFGGGNTHYGYSIVTLGLSLRVPIFSGPSRLSKVRESHMDLLKTQEDLCSLDQPPRMAHLNASLKLQDTQRTIVLRKENQALVTQALDPAQQNFTLGAASLSGVLSASQSLVQAQMAHANVLGDYIKAYTDLKKSKDEIKDLMN